MVLKKELIPTGRDEIGNIERNFASVAKQTSHLIHEVYEAKITSAELLAQKKEAQLLALRSQINPHYLFNTLESIRMNLLLSGDRNTSNIIHLFAESFRECIEDTDKTYTLENALNSLEHYFTIQEYRMRGKIALQTKVSPDVLDCRIPKLILQPLLENAIYHGLELKEGNGQVCLSAKEENGVLWITITDDGIGMTEERLTILRQYLEQHEETPSTGECLALRNVNSRLRLLYGNSYGIEIESRLGQGTRLKISLAAIHEKRQETDMYKVLIADDDPAVREGLPLLIDWQSVGFEIADVAENGRCALDLLRTDTSQHIFPIGIHFIITHMGNLIFRRAQSVNLCKNLFHLHTADTLYTPLSDSLIRNQV